jgi:hypothetical protein
MDPEPTVALNNKEAMLSGQEEEEEARILAALSAAMAARSARIWQVRALKLRLHFPQRHDKRMNGCSHSVVPHRGALLQGDRLCACRYWMQWPPWMCAWRERGMQHGVLAAGRASWIQKR